MISTWCALHMFILFMSITARASSSVTPNMTWLKTGWTVADCCFLFVGKITSFPVEDSPLENNPMWVTYVYLKLIYVYLCSICLWYTYLIYLFILYKYCIDTFVDLFVFCRFLIPCCWLRGIVSGRAGWKKRRRLLDWRGTCLMFFVCGGGDIMGMLWLMG